MNEQQTTTVFGLFRSAILALLVGTLILGPSMALAATNTASFGIAASPSINSNTVTLFSVDTTSLQLFKRAFLADGTPIVDSSTLPIGTTVKFMIYVDNFTGSAVSDLNITDTLTVGEFSYVSPSIKMLNTLANCAAADGTCTPAEEALMFTALDGAGALTDAISTADPVGYDIPSTTVSAGRTAGNQQLNIVSGQAWGLLFTTTIN